MTYVTMFVPLRNMLFFFYYSIQIIRSTNQNCDPLEVHTYVQSVYQLFNLGKDSINYTLQSEHALLTCGMSLLFMLISYNFYFWNILALLPGSPNLPGHLSE